jgi:hypothetical protein
MGKEGLYNMIWGKSEKWVGKPNSKKPLRDIVVDRRIIRNRRGS